MPPADAAAALPSPVAAGAGEEERTLRELVARHEAGRVDLPLPGDLAPAVFARLDERGQGRLALALLDRLAELRPRDAELAMRVALLHLDRREYGHAVPLLEGLTDDPRYAARARVLLAQRLSDAGDPASALRHLEAALARDLDEPQALARAESLRARLRREAAGTAAPTLLGGKGLRAIQQRSRIVRELGRGASAVVYLAHDEGLDRPVALKLLHPHLYASARSRDRGRFFAEARLAAGLQSPAIVTVYDLDEPLNLIVMECCAAGTLRERLKRGRLPLELGLRRAAELFSALAFVHRRGVCHGDLKPGNLLFRADADDPADPLVLADFGVAFLARGASGTAEAQLPAGTFPYMAPEQRAALATTERSDVFAAAAIAHELLTGASPPATAWPAHVRDPRPAEETWSAVPAPLREELRALTGACLDARPDRRPDASEAARRLRALIPEAVAATERDRLRAELSSRP